MEKRINDWLTLDGAKVEIRQHETVVAAGVVDAVTEDGGILWLHSPAVGRRLFEKAEFFQVWADEEHAGFHYKVFKADIKR